MAYQVICYHGLLRFCQIVSMQAVVINKATSELVSVRSGVPEGTVIGPLLLYIYIYIYIYIFIYI